MPDSDREAGVLAAVVSLVDSLLHDFDVVDLLTDLTEQCARLLDIASAGLLLADPGGQLHLLASTSERTEELELFQLQSDEGPCLDCWASGEPVSVADLTDALARWPLFVPAARDAGFASVHAVPLRAAGSVLGALGLFGTDPGALGEADLLVAHSLAHIAGVAIVQEHAPTPDVVLPRLRRALVGRVVVEQAKGYLHERLDVPVADALDLMRRHARATGTHLTEVARALVSDRNARPAIVAGIAALLGTDATPGDR